MHSSYPDNLEQWWIREAVTLTGHADAADSLDALQTAAGRLSDLFTTARPTTFHDYVADPALRTAYGLFFFPRSYVRIRLILDELARRAPAGPPFARVLDLGSGLGAATFAAMVHAQAATPGIPAAFTAVDRSPDSLAVMERIHADNASSWSAARLATIRADIRDYQPPDSEPAFDLILMSFVLNEALGDSDMRRWHDWVRAWLSCLSPDGCLIIVEPAGNEASPRLERLRDALLESDSARVRAPCLHSIPCPMLREDRRYCHEVRHWQVPASMERLNRHLFRSIHDIKFSFLALSPASTGAGPGPTVARGDELCRLVAPVSRQKGRVITAGCFASGQLHDIEMLTRHLKPGAPNPSRVFERGDLVQVDSPVPIGNRPTLRVSGFAPAFAPRT